MTVDPDAELAERFRKRRPRGVRPPWLDGTDLVALDTDELFELGWDLRALNRRGGRGGHDADDLETPAAADPTGNPTAGEV